MAVHAQSLANYFDSETAKVLGACTACGKCAAVAPDAVAQSEDFELATTARSALIKKIPIRGDER